MIAVTLRNVAEMLQKRGLGNRDSGLGATRFHAPRCKALMPTPRLPGLSCRLRFPPGCEPGPGGVLGPDGKIAVLEIASVEMTDEPDLPA